MCAPPEDEQYNYRWVTGAGGYVQQGGTYTWAPGVGGYVQQLGSYTWVPGLGFSWVSAG